jgi:hypothetical protein
MKPQAGGTNAWVSRIAPKMIEECERKVIVLSSHG